MGASKSKQNPYMANNEAKTFKMGRRIAPFAEKLLNFSNEIQGAVLLPPTKCETDEDKAKWEAYHKQRSRAYSYNDGGYPVAVVLVESKEDIVKVVSNYKSWNLEEEGIYLALASGAHSHNAFPDGAFVIDMEKLNKVEVDYDGRTMTAECGTKIQVADNACAEASKGKPVKLGFVTGTNGDTGMFGLTLIAGIGYLSPKHGFACQNIISLDVCLPDGKVITVTDDNEYADLMKACRGGGGNFGVVLSMTVKLHEVTSCFGGTYVVMAPTLGARRNALMKYVKCNEEAPNDALLGCGLACGAPVFINIMSYINDDCKDAKTFKQVPVLQKAVANSGGWFAVENKLQKMDYHSDMQTMLEKVQTRHTSVTSAFSIDKMTPEMVDVLLRFTSKEIPNKKSVILIFPIRGEMKNPKYLERSTIGFDAAEYWAIIEGVFDGTSEEDFVRTKDWVQNLKEALMKVGGSDTGHGFFDGEKKQREMGSAYYFGERKKYLQQMKAKYDPTNLFRMNANISPLNHHGQNCLVPENNGELVNS